MLRPDTFALTALLGLLSGLGPMSVDMYLASLPAIGRALDADTAAVQLTISIYLGAFAIGQALYGPISDRRGRKPVLLVALSIYCVASIACAIAPSIMLLTAARGVQALGGAGAIVLARAIVRDMYKGARAGKELSLMSAIMGFAPIAAPLIGGALQVAFGWRASFVVLVVLGVVALVTIWLLLPETLREKSREPLSIPAMLRGFRDLLRHRGYVAYFWITAATYGGLFAWISGSPFVLQNVFHLTAFEFGLAFAVSSTGFLVGTTLASRIVIPLGLDRTVGIGVSALAVGGILSVLGIALGLAWPIALIAPMLIFFAGLGLITPSAMAGALTPFPDRAGSASSLIGFVQQTSGALVGALLGHALGASAWPLVVTMALMGIIAFLVWLVSRDARAHSA